MHEINSEKKEVGEKYGEKMVARSGCLPDLS